MPACFIVDRESIIRYAQYEPDATVRPEPEHTLAVLRSLAGDSHRPAPDGRAQMKIYTGTGDRGMTGLFSGERVAKDSERIEAYGTVDELNSVLGALRAALPPRRPELIAELQSIQGDLFRIGAWLATTPGSSAAASLDLLDPQRITTLEGAIDRIDAALPPLAGFILPGGSLGAGWAHVARTVCRRAERRVAGIAAGDQEPGAAPLTHALVYLNRLSDYLFVLARHINHSEGVEETLWRK